MLRNTHNTSPKNNVSQDELLLQNLLEFYKNIDHMEKVMAIVNGESDISLRIVDWFVTNFAKQQYTSYMIPTQTGILKDIVEDTKFKVYDRYKLQLKAYSKRRFDPFCRWERISIPYRDGLRMETTLGQLNFFKWAIEHRVLEYIAAHYQEIERDMNQRNSNSSSRSSRNSTASSQTTTASSVSTDVSSLASAASATVAAAIPSIENNKKEVVSSSLLPAIHTPLVSDGKTRKRRQQLSEPAFKCVKKEDTKIVVRFND